VRPSQDYFAAHPARPAGPSIYPQPTGAAPPDDVRVGGDARPAFAVRKKKSPRRHDETPNGCVVEVGNAGEGIDALHEQDLALVNVPDAGHSPLV